MQFNTEIELGVGLPLFGSQLVPLEGCLVIFGDTISTVVKDTQTYLRFSLPPYSKWLPLLQRGCIVTTFVSILTLNKIIKVKKASRRRSTKQEE